MIPPPYYQVQLLPADAIQYAPAQPEHIPESLLKVYVQFYERNAPDVFVLCIRGISFELGGSLTLQAAANLSAALDFVKLCLLDLDVLSWDSQCTQQALGVSIRSAQETNQITR